MVEGSVSRKRDGWIDIAVGSVLHIYFLHIT